MSTPSPRALRSAAILGLALLVRVVFAAGYQGQDDKHYILNAATLAADGRIPIEVQTLWVTRIGHWLPIAGTFHLFGVNEWVASIYVMACSLGSVFLVLLLGRVLIGERGAVLAAFLAAIFPLDACYATTAFVDLTVAFFMLLALYHLLVGQRTGSAGRFFVAGLAMGWSYLCRESAVQMAIPIGIYFLVQRWSWAQLRAIGGGVAVVLACESIFWGLVAGDPLFRYQQGGSKIEELAVDRSPDGQIVQSEEGGWLPGPESRSARRSTNSVVDFALMFATNEEFGLFGVLAWLLIIYHVARRRRDLWELIVWIVSLALLFGFVPWVFPYTLPRDPRYYACLTGPVVLLIAYHAMRWRASVRWLVVSTLVVTSLAGLVVTQPTRGVRVEREFAASLADFRAGELYVSPELSSFLTVYTGNTRPAGVTIHLLEEGAQSDGWQAVRALWPDAPVVTRLSEMRSGHAAFFRALNPARVPSGWRPVAEFATLTPPLTLRSIGVLQALGVPRSIVRRLLPGQDRSIFVYAID